MFGWGGSSDVGVGLSRNALRGHGLREVSLVRSRFRATQPGAGAHVARNRSSLPEPPPMTFSWPWALLSLLIIPIVAGRLVAAATPAARGGAGDLDRPGTGRAATPYEVDPAHPDPLAPPRLRHAQCRAARPQANVPVPSNSTTIMLAMDVSGSMCSTDVEPNRLTVPRRRPSPSSSPWTERPRSVSSSSRASPASRCHRPPIRMR